MFLRHVDFVPVRRVRLAADQDGAFLRVPALPIQAFKGHLELALSVAVEGHLHARVMARALLSLWVVGNRRLKFHAMKFHEIS